MFRIFTAATFVSNGFILHLYDKVVKNNNAAKGNSAAEAVTGLPFTAL